MKKITALVLLLALCLTLVGCKKEYEPIESTDAEAAAVMTLSFADRKYTVRYELYRALFLTYRSEVDGGDHSVWQGEEKDKYIAEIQELILERVVDIYSTFALAHSLGIDPYSVEVESAIEDYVRIGVEGGSLGSDYYPGYETYDAYLDALKEKYLNYSVQALLFRYAIVSDMIDEYYLGELTEDDIAAGISANADGKLKYTRDDVLAFYNSDECVRVLRTFVSEDMTYDPEARAQSVREHIAAEAYKGEEAVRAAMIDQGSTTSVPELEAGYVIAEHNLSKSYYSSMVDAALALAPGEVSEIIKVHDGNKLSYYVLYRAEKSDAHFDESYASIAYAYLRNEIGKKYAECAEAMMASVSYTELGNSLDHSAISMD